MGPTSEVPLPLHSGVIAQETDLWEARKRGAERGGEWGRGWMRERVGEGVDADESGGGGD